MSSPLLAFRRDDGTVRYTYYRAAVVAALVSACITIYLLMVSPTSNAKHCVGGGGARQHPHGFGAHRHGRDHRTARAVTVGDWFDPHTARLPSTPRYVISTSSVAAAAAAASTASSPPSSLLGLDASEWRASAVAVPKVPPSLAKILQSAGGEVRPTISFWSDDAFLGTELVLPVDVDVAKLPESINGVASVQMSPLSLVRVTLHALPNFKGAFIMLTADTVTLGPVWSHKVRSVSFSRRHPLRITRGPPQPAPSSSGGGGGADGSNGGLIPDYTPGVKFLFLAEDLTALRYPATVTMTQLAEQLLDRGFIVHFWLTEGCVEPFFRASITSARARHPLHVRFMCHTDPLQPPNYFLQSDLYSHIVAHDFHTVFVEHDGAAPASLLARYLDMFRVHAQHTRVVAFTTSLTATEARDTETALAGFPWVRPLYQSQKTGAQRVLDAAFGERDVLRTVDLVVVHTEVERRLAVSMLASTQVEVIAVHATVVHGGLNPYAGHAGNQHSDRRLGTKSGGVSDSDGNAGAGDGVKGGAAAAASEDDDVDAFDDDDGVEEQPSNLRSGPDNAVLTTSDANTRSGIVVLYDHQNLHTRTLCARLCVEWFMTYVGPMLAAATRERETVTLLGYADDHVDELRQLANPAGLTLAFAALDRFDDIVKAARVVVVPSVCHSGVDLNLLSSIASGTPLVTTSRAAATFRTLHADPEYRFDKRVPERLQSLFDRGVAVADTAVAFADAVDRLCSDVHEWTRVQAAAVDYVYEYHTRLRVAQRDVPALLNALDGIERARWHRRPDPPLPYVETNIDLMLDRSFDQQTEPPF